MSDNYRCPNCNSVFPLSNKTLHDLRCPGLNRSNFNNNRSSALNSSNNNNNRNNNQRNQWNNVQQFNNNNNRNNIIATNISSQSNPDGTRTETKIETFQNGIQRVTKTKYDQFNNRISTQQYHQNNNNFNNFNNFNNNDFNNNNNNNNNIQRTTDQFGNVTETRTERLPNGGIRKTTIIRDRNGNIIGQSISSFGGGGNNFNNNFQMNNFNGNYGNMMMNNMNNNMGMNNMFYNMDMNMMNNMPNNMNMNDDNMNNGVPSDIIDCLNTTQLDDVSKLQDDKKNCVICLEDFKNGDEVLYLPCFHLFHKTCLLNWFRGHDDCPICKTQLNYQNMNFQ